MQQIRIVIESLVGHVPIAFVTLHLEDALSICLNRNLARKGPPLPRGAARQMSVALIGS